MAAEGRGDYRWIQTSAAQLENAHRGLEPSPLALANPLPEDARATQMCPELILVRQHACGPDCLYWKLRQVPAISDAIRQLHVQKLQANKRPV